MMEGFTLGQQAVNQVGQVIRKSQQSPLPTHRRRGRWQGRAAIQSTEIGPTTTGACPCVTRFGHIDPVESPPFYHKSAARWDGLESIRTELLTIPGFESVTVEDLRTEWNGTYWQGPEFTRTCDIYTTDQYVVIQKQIAPTTGDPGGWEWSIALVGAPSATPNCDDELRWVFRSKDYAIYGDRTNEMRIDTNQTPDRGTDGFVDPPSGCLYCLKPYPGATLPCQTIDFATEVYVDEYDVYIPFIGSRLPNGVSDVNLSQCYYGDADNRTIYPDYGLSIGGGLYVAINATGDFPAGLIAYDYNLVFAVSPNDIDNRAYYNKDFADAAEMGPAVTSGSVLTIAKNAASTLSGAPASVTLRFI